MSDTKNEPRGWTQLLAASIIALVALGAEIDGKLKDQGKQVKWAASALSITLGFAGLGVLAVFLIRDKFAGTHLEGGMALLCLVFMAAGLPAIMDPAHNLAQSASGGVQNANLYFFSWGALIMALKVFMSFAFEKWGNTEGKNKFFKPFTWGGLCASAFVCMAAAVRTYKNLGCEDMKDENICRRTKYGVSVGVICGILAFLWMLIGSKVWQWLDALLGVVMLVFWVFGVGYLTFGDDAPAKDMGNLYFSTWICFIISVSLCATGLMHMFHKEAAPEETPEEEKKPEGDEETPAAPADEPAQQAE